MTILKTFFRQTDRLTWIGIILALMILVYGWTARFLHIYFFWESAWYGWTVFLIAVIFFLARRIMHKKTEKKKTGFDIVCLVFAGFFLTSQLSLLIIFNQSDAYVSAQRYFKKHKSYEQEVGPIEGFSIHPFGYMQYHWGTGGECGQAELDIIIKGEKKYKEVSIVLVKYTDAPQWEVVEVHDPCGYCWIKDFILSMFLDQED